MDDKFYGLNEKDYNRLPPEAQEGVKRAYESKQKVKAMQDRILEECRKQGFTIGEVKVLAERLNSEAKNRRVRSWGQFF